MLLGVEICSMVDNEKCKVCGKGEDLVRFDCK